MSEILDLVRDWRAWCTALILLGYLTAAEVARRNPPPTQEDYHSAIEEIDRLVEEGKLKP